MYIAAVTATTFVVDVATKMTIGMMPIPGIKTILGALFTMPIVAIGLMWIKKVGTLSVINLLRGIIAGFIMPGLPFMALAIVGGVAGDLATKLLKGNYENGRYVILACSVYMLTVIPVMNYGMLLMGYPEVILTPQLIVSVTLLCVALTALSTFVGTRIATELRRAGVI